jgi:hypothetical protein
MRKFLVFWYDGDWQRVSIVHTDKEPTEDTLKKILENETDGIINGVVQLNGPDDQLYVRVNDEEVIDPENVYEK